jgi:hypothetical protein
MTDPNVPGFDETYGNEGDESLSEYDALPDEPNRLSEDNEFEGLNITESDGPDL